MHSLVRYRVKAGFATRLTPQASLNLAIAQNRLCL